MKKFSPVVALALLIFAMAAVVVSANSAMSAWPFFVDVTPQASRAGIYQFVVPLQVMDKAREDIADLRLIDAGGREVPYALRVRRDADDTHEVAARLFNQVTVGSSAAEASVDLGDDPGEHNEVEIETEGMNFRRLVDIEGSDSGRDWKSLGGDTIYSFGTSTNQVQSNRASYVQSRYHYLRVRVFADQPHEKTPPIIKGVKVLMAVREKGEFTTWDVSVPPYQLLRHEGAPASSWTMDLGGRVPCDRLSLTTEEQSFSRPYQVEVLDDPQNVNVVASGELTKHSGDKAQTSTIAFDKEVYARKLRLLIVDYNNPTLSINSIKAVAPARQVYFELKDISPQPLKLFFGNTNADAPHYDFEKELSAKLKTPAPLTFVGSYVSNPDYQPPRLPFTEREPWSIYVVLTVSSVALALILLSLARATMRMDTVKNRTSAPPA